MVIGGKGQRPDARRVWCGNKRKGMSIESHKDSMSEHCGRGEAEQHNVEYNLMHKERDCPSGVWMRGRKMQDARCSAMHRA